MKWFRNMKIGKKLIATFLLMAIITAIVSGVGVLFLSEITSADTYMYEYMTEPIAHFVFHRRTVSAVAG